MNRVEPNRNVYIGHRYVPLLVGEWDNSIQYEGLSIVTYKGASYTSKKMTPAGIDIENEEYWVVTGNYNAQIEYYRQDVARVQEDVETLRTDTEQEILEVRTYVNDQTQETRDYVDGETIETRQYMDDNIRDTMKNRVIQASDYGITPDGGNVSQAMSDMVTDLKSLTGSKTIRFNEGAYDMDGLTLSNMDDFKFIGDGRTVTTGNWKIGRSNGFIMDNIHQEQGFLSLDSMWRSSFHHLHGSIDLISTHSNFGSYWNSFYNCGFYHDGERINGMEMYGTSTNEGVNSNSFYSCIFRGKPGEGSGLNAYTDGGKEITDNTFYNCDFSYGKTGFTLGEGTSRFMFISSYTENTETPFDVSNSRGSHKMIGGYTEGGVTIDLDKFDIFAPDNVGGDRVAQHYKIGDNIAPQLKPTVIDGNVPGWNKNSINAEMIQGDEETAGENVLNLSTSQQFGSLNFTIPPEKHFGESVSLMVKVKVPTDTTGRPALIINNGNSETSRTIPKDGQWHVMGVKHGSYIGNNTTVRIAPSWGGTAGNSNILVDFVTVGVGHALQYQGTGELEHHIGELDHYGDMEVHGEFVTRGMLRSDEMRVPHGSGQPSNAYAGQVYFDTTLNKPLFYNGSNWVDAMGNNI